MFTMFRPRLRSRHPSHSVLRPTRKKLPLLPFKSIIRLGSTTEIEGDRIEINSVEAVKNSSNKFKMKSKFTENGVITAEWWLIDFNEDGSFKFKNPISFDTVEYENISFPLVAKKFFGSRNEGNTLIKTLDELEDYVENNQNNNYLIEKFYNYTREYRIHVTENGYFYTCRKMLKRDTPSEQKWFRNDQHCVWITEENELFDKPVNWDLIVEHSVKALKAVGLDIGAVDLKIQSATNKEEEIRDNPKFIIIEINSAPSFGSTTEKKYIEILPELLKQKYEQK